MLRLVGIPRVRLGVMVLSSEIVDEFRLVTARIVELEFLRARVSRNEVIVAAKTLPSVESVISVVVLSLTVGRTVMRLGLVLIIVVVSRLLTVVVRIGLRCTRPMRLVKRRLPMMPVPRNLVMSVSRNSMVLSIMSILDYCVSLVTLFFGV